MIKAKSIDVFHFSLGANSDLSLFYDYWLRFKNRLLLFYKAEEFLTLNVLISGTIGLIRKKTSVSNRPFIEEGCRINYYAIIRIGASQLC